MRFRQLITLFACGFGAFADWSASSGPEVPSDAGNFYQQILQTCSLIAEGARFLVDNSTSCDRSAVISSLFRRSELPVLRVPDDRTSVLCPSDGQARPEVVPPERILLEAIKHDGWTKSIILFHRTRASLSVLSGLRNSLSVSWAAFEWERTRLPEMFAFAELKENCISPIVLLLPLEKVKIVLQTMTKLQIRRTPYKLFIYDPSVRRAELRLLLQTDDSVALLEPEVVTCNNSLPSLLANLTQGSKGSRGSQGSVANCESTLDPRDKLLTRQKIDEIVERECPEVAVLYRIYSNKQELPGSAHMKEVANFQRRLSFGDQLFPNKFRGFHGRKFRVDSLEYSFFARKVPLGNGSFVWDGLTIKVLNALAQDLNFTYEAVEPADGAWGIAGSDGNWNGAIRDVMDGSVDFAAMGFSVSAQRSSVVDFTASFFRETSAVILRQPSEANKAFLLLRPFNWTVWLTICVAVLVGGFLLWVFTIISPDEYVTVKKAMWYTFGAMIQQGGTWLPKSYSARFMLATYWFYVIIMVATYTGNMIAFLAVPIIQMPFKNLLEMSRQSSVTYGVVDSVQLEMLFRDAHNEPYKSIGASMKNVVDYAEGERRVADGSYAFLAELSYFWYLKNINCDVTVLKETFFPSDYAMAIPKGSYLGPILSESIIQMKESGLLKHWLQESIPSSLHCVGLSNQSSARAATIADLQGAFYLLGIGMLISSPFIVYERSRNRLRKSRCRVSQLDLPPEVHPPPMQPPTA